MVVIAINGASGVGKDTVIDFIREEAKKDYRKIDSIDSVAKVKEAAKLLGWNGVKDPSSRAFLHMLKLISDDAYNASTKYIMDKIAYCVAEGVSVAFVHIREADSIRKLESALTKYPIPFITLLVKGNDEGETIYGDGTIEDLEYDYVIDNTRDLIHLKGEAIRVFKNIDETYL